MYIIDETVLLLYHHYRIFHIRIHWQTLLFSFWQGGQLLRLAHWPPAVDAGGVEITNTTTIAGIAHIHLNQQLSLPPGSRRGSHRPPFLRQWGVVAMVPYVRSCPPRCVSNPFWATWFSS